jgi:hypothetical protein
MRALLAVPLAVSFIAFAMAPLSAHAQQTPWIVGNPATGEYTLDAVGLVTDLDGARLTLRSITPGTTPVGTAIARIPAGAYKQRRVRLRGEVRTRKVEGGGASLWLRVDGPSGMLALDNGSDQAVRGDSGWASQAITLLVSGDAARLVFGALLRGTGEMEVRGLRLDTLAASIGAGSDAERELRLDRRSARQRWWEHVPDARGPEAVSWNRRTRCVRRPGRNAEHLDRRCHSSTATTRVGATRVSLCRRTHWPAHRELRRGRHYLVPRSPTNAVVRCADGRALDGKRELPASRRLDDPADDGGRGGSDGKAVWREGRS